MKQRLRALLATTHGRVILVAGLAALVGVLVIARRKASSKAAGATDPKDAAANTNAGALLDAAGNATWADYGTVAPYAGGSIGPGGLTTGPSIGDQELLSWMSDIGGQLDKLTGGVLTATDTANNAANTAGEAFNTAQAASAQAAAAAVFTPPPVQGVTPPPPAAPVATPPPKPAAPAPAAPKPPAAAGSTNFNRSAIAWGSLYLAKTGGGKQAVAVSKLTDAQIIAALGNGFNNGALAAGWKRLPNGSVVRV